MSWYGMVHLYKDSILTFQYIVIQVVLTSLGKTQRLQHLISYYHSDK